LDFCGSKPNVFHKIGIKMKKTFVILVAMLFVTFAFSQTKTEIKPADVSPGVTSYINKNFSGYNIDKAFKVDSKGVISTEVMVSKGNEKLALTFDKDLKLTKKEAIKPDGRIDKKSLAPAKEGNMTPPPKK
jgi:hypothetical protein